jgi:aspartokinase/homoserine dehydrogenase 1
MDVARKALILARMLGWRIELEDVQLKGLFPEEMSSLAVEEFLGEIRSLDEEYAALAKRAGAEGKALRYAATIAEAQCKVGMEAFSVHHPLGQLVGVDQLLAIHSRWYDPLPLVIQGRGAGADATAAGVLSDILELATH